MAAITDRPGFSVTPPVRAVGSLAGPTVVPVSPGFGLAIPEWGQLWPRAGAPGTGFPVFVLTLGAANPSAGSPAGLYFRQTI